MMRGRMRGTMREQDARVIFRVSIKNKIGLDENLMRCDAMRWLLYHFHAIHVTVIMSHVWSDAADSQMRN